ncbi:MAG: hypothetical protein H0W92_01675, partial [Sphingomonas sp.]|nr:hypothetical protein [Sphingomonas sp.]
TGVEGPVALDFGLEEEPVADPAAEEPLVEPEAPVAEEPPVEGNAG